MAVAHGARSKTNAMNIMGFGKAMINIRFLGLTLFPLPKVQEPREVYRNQHRDQCYDGSLREQVLPKKV
jgi:hypothetical protein